MATTSTFTRQHVSDERLFPHQLTISIDNAALMQPVIPISSEQILGKSYAVYNISISISGANPMEWHIWKRYNEFKDFHHQLLGLIPNLSIRLPPKQIFGRFQTEFIHRRRIQLEKYMNDIKEHMKIVNSVQFRSFLLIHSSKEMTQIQCECGADLKLLSGSKIWSAYGSNGDSNILCNLCKGEIGHSQRGYHCTKKYITAHQYGYDLCTLCASKRVNQANGVTFGPMSAPQSPPPIDLIQNQRSCGSLGNYQFQRTNKELQSKLDDAERMLSEALAVNEAVQRENVKLLNGQKESRLKIQELEQRFAEFEMKAMDCSLFVEWDWQRVLHWILSLENGRFKKYETELRQALSKEHVKGECLRDVDIKDMKNWGIGSFGDKVALMKHIATLVSGNVQKAVTSKAIEAQDDVKNFVCVNDECFTKCSKF